MQWLNYQDDPNDSDVNIPFFCLKGDSDKKEYENFLQNFFLNRWFEGNPSIVPIFNNVCKQIRCVVFYKDVYKNAQPLKEEQYVYIEDSDRVDETPDTIYCIGCVERSLNNNHKKRKIENPRTVKLFMIGFIRTSHPVLQAKKRINKGTGLIIHNRAITDNITLFSWRHLSLDFEKIIGTQEMEIESNISILFESGIYIFSKKNLPDKKEDRDFMKHRMNLESDFVNRIQFLGKLHKLDHENGDELKEDQILQYPVQDRDGWVRDKILINFLCLVASSNDEISKRYAKTEALYLQNNLSTLLTDKERDEILKMNNMNKNFYEGTDDMSFELKLCSVQEENLINEMQHIKGKFSTIEKNEHFSNLVKKCQEEMEDVFISFQLT